MNTYPIVWLKKILYFFAVCDSVKNKLALVRLKVFMIFASNPGTLKKKNPLIVFMLTFHIDLWQNTETFQDIDVIYIVGFHPQVMK